MVLHGAVLHGLVFHGVVLHGLVLHGVAVLHNVCLPRGLYADTRICVYWARMGETFGQVLAAGRRAAGLSQRELAARILKEDGEPISPQYLNDLERDRRNPPAPHLLKQFAEALNLPEEYLSFAAGQLPEDLRNPGASYAPDQVQAAFQAFRRSLRG